MYEEIGTSLEKSLVKCLFFYAHFYRRFRVGECCPYLTMATQLNHLEETWLTILRLYSMKMVK